MLKQKNVFLQHISTDGKCGYQLKAGQVKPFVVSLSNHERLNRPTLRQAQGERVSLDRVPP